MPEEESECEAPTPEEDKVSVFVLAVMELTLVGSSLLEPVADAAVCDCSLERGERGAEFLSLSSLEVTNTLGVYVRVHMCVRVYVYLHGEKSWLFDERAYATEGA